MELIRVDTRKAYEEIKRKIVRLELRPGAAIDEEALAAELDLAPTAVREALKLLVHDNLVVVGLRHGIRVAETDLGDLRQLFEMRLPLETLCARLAALRATPDDIAVMESLGREFEQAKRMRNMDQLLDLDHRFHRSLADAAHNRYMRETLEQFFGLSERLWQMALPQIDWLVPALEQHMEVVDAVRAHDVARAEALMSEHVLDFQRHVEKELHLLPA